MTYFNSYIQARLWACGRGDMSTPSFGRHLNPISTRGGRVCPPYTGVQVLKATGTPDIIDIRKRNVVSTTVVFVKKIYNKNHDVFA